ncbi:MAG: cobalamin-dependent protein [Elusimicrobia bacterium]|nr:cobalamin-dependent protein [Elusimicrobiota bacterium]
MKILLIDPPFGFEEIGGSSKDFKEVMNIIPSLGLAYLASVLEKEGHTVKIIDCTLGLTYTDIEKEAKKFTPDITGISATTPTYNNAKKSASAVKKAVPKSVLIIGGAHPTALPEEVIKEGTFDFAVLGEGEETLSELVKKLYNKENIKSGNIRGIAFQKDEKVIITQPRPRIDNPDSLPFPARHLLPPLKAYSPTPASYRKLPLAVIMTSRGCPARCTFCDKSVFGENFRTRSADNVLAEAEEVIRDYGAKEIRFFDDCFTLNPARVEEICRGMKKLKIPWTCLTKTTSVTPQILRIMYESGCWQVLFGLESGDDTILKYLGKGNTVEQNRKAVQWAKNAGMSVRADFLVGSPLETIDTLNKTLKFAKELPLDYAHFNKFVPFPGTEIYKNLVSKGNKPDFNGSSSTLNHDALVYIPEGINKSEYRRFLDKAYKEFYLRPGYILRRLMSIRTPQELAGQIKGFVSIIRL